MEGDYSQAAFPAVLGAVTGGVAITGLSEETLQGDAAILKILRRCGDVYKRQGLFHGECVALGMLPMIESKALQKRVRAVYRRIGRCV